MTTDFSMSIVFVKSNMFGDVTTTSSYLFTQRHRPSSSGCGRDHTASFHDANDDDDDDERLNIVLVVVVMVVVVRCSPPYCVPKKNNKCPTNPVCTIMRDVSARNGRDNNVDIEVHSMISSCPC